MLTEAKQTRTWKKTDQPLFKTPEMRIADMDMDVISIIRKGALLHHEILAKSWPPLVFSRSLINFIINIIITVWKTLLSDANVFAFKTYDFRLASK
jgi:hypothetical protein